MLQRLTRLGDIKRRLADGTGPAIDPSQDPGTQGSATHAGVVCLAARELPLAGMPLRLVRRRGGRVLAAGFRV